MTRDPFTLAIVRVGQLTLGGIGLFLLTGYLTIWAGIVGAIAAGLAWGGFILWVFRLSDADAQTWADEKGDKPWEVEQRPPPTDEERWYHG